MSESPKRPADRETPDGEAKSPPSATDAGDGPVEDEAARIIREALAAVESAASDADEADDGDDEGADAVVSMSASPAGDGPVDASATSSVDGGATSSVDGGATSSVDGGATSSVDGSATSEADGASASSDATASADEDDLPADAPLVLVVEDETPIANLLREMLSERGCRVRVADDGQAGLDAFRRERPSAVFCDLLLPRRNGFQLLEDFNAAAPEVPVFIMTGVYHGDSYREAVAAARAFLAKPFDDEELRRACDEAAATRRDPSVVGGEDVELPAPAPSRQPWIPTSVLPLPRVLQALRRERRTGLLTHRCGERHTVFQLSEGVVGFVRGNDPSARLGRLLRQLGAVDEDALRDAEADLASRTRRTRLGEVLVERGAIDYDTLHDALQLQLRRLVADAFSAEGGDTLFQETSAADVRDEDVVLDADPRAIVVAGCAAWQDPARTLLAHLPDPATDVEVALDPDEARLRLTPAIRRLVEAVREPTPLGRVLAMADLVGLRSAPVVYGLLSADVLRPVVRAGVSTQHVPVLSGGAQLLPEGVLPQRALLDIEEARATGVLRVALDGGRAWLAFRNGHPCAAGSAQARSRLGERLVDAGLLKPEQLELALFRQAKKPGQPLGRILVEQGSLDPAQLLHAVRSQVVAIATELATAETWTDARFEDGHLPQCDPVPVGTTSELLAGAIRKLPVRALERLAGTLARRRPTLALERLDPERFALTETEDLVRATLPSEARCVLEALAGEDRSDPDVLRLAVLALLVTPAEPRPVAA